MQTIHGKDLYNFQGQSTASTGWFYLYHEWLKRKFSTPETDFYKKRFINNIEGQDIKTHRTFVVLLDNTRLYL